MFTVIHRSTMNVLCLPYYENFSVIILHLDIYRLICGHLTNYTKSFITSSSQKTLLIFQSYPAVSKRPKKWKETSHFPLFSEQ